MDKIGILLPSSKHVAVCMQQLWGNAWHPGSVVKQTQTNNATTSNIKVKCVLKEIS